ncbi:MAG: barstar family protein [Deltaproteobacteria bacterium]|nr:barstar family protein [Deltaproteobacteria bacterium]
MPVKKCMLNGRMIRSLDDFYDQLLKRLSLPEYFGRNLDALWDVLSTDVEGPFEIIWKYADNSKNHMGDDFNRAIKVLRDLEKERTDFRLTIDKKDNERGA